MADRKDTPEAPPVFDMDFIARFRDLVRWRRDVRRFRPDPVPAALIDGLLDIASLSPSVGNAQPWRFVAVESAERRARILADFEAANRDAAARYRDAQADLYRQLKLEGLKLAPVQLAVFSDEATGQGAGLGRQTMPETLSYSVVGAIQTLWLAARAEGLGMGWVSILHPDAMNELLGVPPDWRFIAYLCLGWPAEEHLDPELERAGWQARTEESRRAIRR